MQYSTELAADFAAHRDDYNDTDPDLLLELEKVGVFDKRVVDIGCGDGTHALWLAEHGAKQIIGADLSETMIALAQKKTHGHNHLSFVLADGSKLPIASESMDMVISNYVIHYFPQAFYIFSEIARILKQHGVFIGTFNITETAEGFEHLYNQIMPIRLYHRHGSLLIENLIKSRVEIERAIADASFVVQREVEINNRHSVVDDAYPFKEQVKKQAVLMVLQRSQREV